jgi:hypothetical protein
VAYSQGHVHDLVGLRLPDPAEQLLEVGQEGDAGTYRTGRHAPVTGPATPPPPPALNSHGATSALLEA